MTEFHHQQALIDWCAWEARRCPELDLIFHVPNGEHRHPRTAKRLKMMGVKPGVPDLFLPVARRGSHGLFLELKSENGKLSANQRKWRARLEGQGFLYVVATGWQEAAKLILEYLEI